MERASRLGSKLTQYRNSPSFFEDRRGYFGGAAGRVASFNGSIGELAEFYSIKRRRDFRFLPIQILVDSPT